MPRVLVVEDNEATREMLADYLRLHDWEVETAPCGFLALACATARPVDVIVCDLLMPHLDGVGFIQQLRWHDSRVPVVLATAMPELPELDTEELQPLVFLEKPFDPDALLVVLRSLVPGDVVEG